MDIFFLLYLNVMPHISFWAVIGVGWGPGNNKILRTLAIDLHCILKKLNGAYTTGYSQFSASWRYVRATVPTHTLVLDERAGLGQN